MDQNLSWKRVFESGDIEAVSVMPYNLHGMVGVVTGDQVESGLHKPQVERKGAISVVEWIVVGEASYFCVVWIASC